MWQPCMAVRKAPPCRQHIASTHALAAWACDEGASCPSECMVAGRHKLPTRTDSSPHRLWMAVLRVAQVVQKLHRSAPSRCKGRSQLQQRKVKAVQPDVQRAGREGKSVGREGLHDQLGGKLCQQADPLICRAGVSVSGVHYRRLGTPYIAGVSVSRGGHLRQQRHLLWLGKCPSLHHDENLV
jgi:hypothetical protein